MAETILFVHSLDLAWLIYEAPWSIDAIVELSGDPSRRNLIYTFVPKVQQ